MNSPRAQDGILELSRLASDAVVRGRTYRDEEEFPKRALIQFLFVVFGQVLRDGKNARLAVELDLVG